VPGLAAIALGQKVDTNFVKKGVVNLCQNALIRNKNIKAFFFECKELACYSEAVRYEIGLPVFDAITACDFFMRSLLDNASG